MLARRKGFYGYHNALAMFVSYLILGGPNYSLGALALPVANEMGWSATQFGFAFSIITSVLALSSPLAGMFISRFGPRLAVVIGSLFMVAAVALMSTTTDLMQFYFFVTLVALGVSFGVLLAPHQLVSNWFFRKRSLMLGLVLAGGGVGGPVYAPFSVVLANTFGSWRTSMLVLAGVGLLPTVLALLFIKDRPEDLGQRVDGDAHEATEETGATAQAVGKTRVYKSGQVWGVGAATRTRAFWLAVVALGMLVFVVQATMAHQVAYLGGEAGMDPLVAATALGLTVGFSAFGRAFGGWLGDRVEPRLVMGFFMLQAAISIIVLLTSQGIVPLYVYVALFGVAYGGAYVQLPGFISNYFGARNLAAIMGVVMPISLGMGALSPVATGLIRDMSGSYVPAFVVMMGLAIVGGISAFMARPPVLGAERVGTMATLN